MGQEQETRAYRVLEPRGLDLSAELHRLVPGARPGIDSRAHRLSGLETDWAAGASPFCRLLARRLSVGRRAGTAKTLVNEHLEVRPKSGWD